MGILESDLRESTMIELTDHLHFVASDSPETRRLARRLLVFAAVHLGDQATGIGPDDQAIETLLELAQGIKL